MFRKSLDKIQKSNFCFKDLLSYFNSEIIMMEWLLHSNTGSLRKHKPSVPCSALLSNIYVIIKAFSGNITDTTKLAYSKIFNLQVPVRLSFHSLAKKSQQNASTFGQDIVLSTIPYFLILRISSYYSIIIFILVCLAKACGHLVLPNVTKNPLLIVSVILWRWSLKTLILSSLKRSNSDFYITDF